MHHTDLTEGQETFNSLLTETILSGRPVLPRNEIIETYVENDGIPLSTIEITQTRGGFSDLGATGHSGHGDPWS
jgi:hypothetical protein